MSTLSATLIIVDPAGDRYAFAPGHVLKMSIIAINEAHYHAP
jgi:hypothetical protein